MRNYFTNAVFAGISLALTAGIVAFSSAPVSAAVPTGETPRAIVRYSDLDLASKAGRAGLETRIHAAAEHVCPASSAVDFAAMRCRDTAIAQARHALAGRLAIRSASSVQTAAL